MGTNLFYHTGLPIWSGMTKTIALLIFNVERKKNITKTGSMKKRKERKGVRLSLLSLLESWVYISSLRTPQLNPPQYDFPNLPQYHFPKLPQLNPPSAECCALLNGPRRGRRGKLHS